MKNLFVILALIFSLSAYSQSYNGIEVGKSFETTKSVVLSKGYVYSKVVSNNAVVYTKTINGVKNNIVLVYTPYTRIVWKIIAEVDYATSWMSAKNKYLRYVGILSDKYGAHVNGEVSFESPYFEGDGYEIQALYLDKAEIYSVYQDQNGNYIMLEMESFDKSKISLLIHYQNIEATKLNDQELERKNSKIY